MGALGRADRAGLRAMLLEPLDEPALHIIQVLFGDTVIKLLAVVAQLFEQPFDQITILIRVRFQRLADDAVDVVAVVVIRVPVDFLEERIVKIGVECRPGHGGRGEEESDGEKAAKGGLERFKHRGKVLESDGLSTRISTLPVIF